MTEYFTSDPHIFHRNVISHCNRPFFTGRELGCAYRDVDAMNEALVENWNSVVKSNDDIVYLLGDCAMNGKKAIEFIERCRGRKRLVRGNHDYDIVKKGAHLFEWVKDYYVATVEAAPLCSWCNNEPMYGVPCASCGFDLTPETVPAKQPHKVVLMHFPIEVWDGKHRCVLHFHGHSHGNLKRTVKGRVDVGADCWDLKPITFEQARARAMSYAPETGDHHMEGDPR